MRFFLPLLAVLLILPADVDAKNHGGRNGILSRGIFARRAAPAVRVVAPAPRAIVVLPPAAVAAGYAERPAARSGEGHGSFPAAGRGD